jgi:TolA-binding protein
MELKKYSQEDYENLWYAYSEGKIATINTEEVTEPTEPVAESQEEVMMNTEMEARLSSMESKLQELGETILKMNEAVLAFGNQSVTEPVKQVEIKEVFSKAPATRFFNK